MMSEKPNVVIAPNVDDGGAESSNGKEEQLESELSKIEEDEEQNGNTDSESKLITLISQLTRLGDIRDPECMWKIIIQIIYVVRSMDLDSQPKPETKLISLITQAISLFHSMDFDSLPKPVAKLISLFSKKISTDSDQKSEYDLMFKSLVDQTLALKPDSELISLIRQIVSVVIYMNSKMKKLMFLCPQVEVYFGEGKFHVVGVWLDHSDEWNCILGKMEKFRAAGEEATHLRCRGCNGEYHKEYEKAPLEIKHPLHQKHSLQLVLNLYSETRECYCCDESLREVFYYCLVCDYAMNIACVEKPPVLSRHHPKWHEHTLVLFPRQTSLTCNACALTHSTCPFYMCPPCDFVVHQRCIGLPCVIRISRHPHRIFFTVSFDQGDWFCSVCRRKIDNDFGGYSCIKDGCSYAVYSRCATQRNVWDGIDLEGVPEEIEEEVEPFERISDGIIRHFSHGHHHLILDENTYRDYDEKKQCEICITPVYFGNIYSCVQCEFVLHETCANLSRKMYHPIHPHRLTLAQVEANVQLMKYSERCSACSWLFTSGFFYECGKEECNFQLHVQCATLSEPLVHESHVHPLFLTSQPGVRRSCHVCPTKTYKNETFNCTECDDFALCFKCAMLPPKVRYKHDKHILTLSYGEETSTMTYWCEACERIINPKHRFYMCDEHCCVTLHIECLVGKDLYVKPGSLLMYYDKQVCVLSNDHHMSRPICFHCEHRCPDKIVFQCSGSIFCSLQCTVSLKKNAS